MLPRPPLVFTIQKYKIHSSADRMGSATARSIVKSFMVNKIAIIIVTSENWQKKLYFLYSERNQSTDEEDDKYFAQVRSGPCLDLRHTELRALGLPVNIADRVRARNQ